MLAKIAQTAADQIARIQEELPFGNKTDASSEIVGNNESFQKPTTAKKMMTTNTTPIQFLRKLRSPSIISRDTSDGSIESSESSHSDCFRCNEANMPNKILGEFGLQIFPSAGKEVVLKYVNDRHFQYIHPNIFAPACLTSVCRMGGGGSGVAVFSGTHPELGEIVMKHGGCSDMKELFALATIFAELTKRGSSEATPKSSEAASRCMKKCLPEFKMVYISPQHVLYKQKAVWGKLKKLVKIGNDRSSRDSFASLAMKIEMSERHKKRSAELIQVAPSLVTLSDSKFLGPGVSIRMYECDTGKPVVYLEDSKLTKKPSLIFIVPNDHTHSVDNLTIALDYSHGFDSLTHLYEGLSPLMSKHLFKFTLAQKRIGGAHAKTGSQWLYEGKLKGLLLDNLIAKFIETVRQLQNLTLQEEVHVCEQIRDEFEKLKSTNLRSDSLSTMADHFMGNSIKKNFHPTKGRIRYLRKTCKDFRDHNLYLLPEEEMPARHLATLGRPDAFMSDVFVGTSSEPPLFHPDKDFWINFMAQAISDRPCMSPNATKRIWTSGLCDAGIHNLFVSQEDLFFFDLGVPQLQSLPGFMTKFLFSFFHILGMEEDKSSEDKEWVRRFVPKGEKLALTKETTVLLSQAYDAFEVSLSRIIDEIFDGDQSLRWLLLQYVTLQLLSDASFCLQRWSMKGGGCPREDNHNQGLERWLWRALWDTYVAFDINTIESWERLKVEDPRCEVSNKSIEENLRKSIESVIGHREFSDLHKLDELMDQLDEEPELEKNHISQSEEFTKAILSHNSSSRSRRPSLMRWSSERLSNSTLREMTAATFEYKDCEDGQPLDDDDDSDAQSNSSDDSAINQLPQSLLCSLSEETTLE